MAPRDTIRRQRSIKNRVKGSEGLPPVLAKAIARDAQRFHVSKSWVKIVAMANGMGIELDEEDYFSNQRVQPRPIPARAHLRRVI